MLRVLKGWSQDEAAEKCGTSKRIYWNWEKGKCYPIANNRKFIARAFGVSENELFTNSSVDKSGIRGEAR
jgi:transcriptional regulator with XRE-family HTH domain